MKTLGARVQGRSRELIKEKKRVTLRLVVYRIGVANSYLGANL